MLAGLNILASSCTRFNSSPLQFGRGTIKDKERSNLVKQQFQDALQRPSNVRVLDHVPLIITHRMDELEKKDRRIDRQRLTFKCLDGDLPRDGAQQLPQLIDAHALPLVEVRLERTRSRPIIIQTPQFFYNRRIITSELPYAPIDPSAFPRVCDF